VETRHLMNIIHYEPSLHSLWVQWNETESGTFTLTENTVIEYGGKVWKLEDAKEVLVPGRKVDMTFTDGQVIAIRVSQGYNGTIESIDTKEMKITVQSEDGKTITLDLTNSTKVYIPNQSSAKLKDLHKGDQIYVELSSDQKKADKIRVRETRMFRVISVNEKDRKLIAADANGSFVTLNIPGGADITDAAKENADFGDIETDEPILVHYRGTSIEAVYIPRAVRGKVTAVDEANSTLTVYDYNKATRKITLSKNAVITIDGDDERLKLSSIAENSRVEVVDDGSGHQFITVMTSGEKKFFKYDKNSGKVSFTKSQINEKNQFDLHPDAFIHDQFTSLNPANLLENTMFNVYFLNGKIVEMEKQ
jgi:antitoxin component of MazEF toxin-antitoxin module